MVARRATLLLLSALGAAPCPSAAWADKIAAPKAGNAVYGPVALSPAAQCDFAITAAAKFPGRAPEKLLPSIARVESGRLDPASGKVRPWPWTINVEGVGYFFESKAEVIAAVQSLQGKGKRSIDVGCMQVNLMHHPKAFADLDEAFDPGANARYAVKFLNTLYQQTRDWGLATAWYHSSTPEFGEEYQRLVFGRVVTPMGAGTTVTGGVKSAVIETWPPAGTRFAAMPPASFNFGAFAPAKPATIMFGGIPMMNTGVAFSLAAPIAPGRAAPFGSARKK